MKVRFWTSVAIFALFGLTACKDKKAAEARYIGAEWFGIRVKFLDIELITPYLIAIPHGIAIDKLFKSTAPNSKTPTTFGC
jgi:hypothetical protein